MQTIDIDLNNKSWLPIGYAWAKPFSGIYDGGGFTIANITLSTTYTYSGLFGTIQNNAVVQQVNISSVTVSADTPECIGGIAGYVMNDCVVKNCSVEDFVATGTNTTSESYIGAIVGDLNNGSTIENCYSNNTKISFTNASADYEKAAGGIVGLCGTANTSYTSSNISGCIAENIYLYASTLAKGYSIMFGGIAGSGFANISFCNSSGEIKVPSTNSAFLGGIVGHGGRTSVYSGSVTISDCSSDVNITSNSAYSNYIGGIYGLQWFATTMTNCRYVGNIVMSGDAQCIVGGLIGRSGDNLKMTSCSFDGSIKCTGLTSSHSMSGGYIGGFVGDSDATIDIQYCTLNGSAQDDSSYGAFKASCYTYFNSASSSTRTIKYCIFTCDYAGGTYSLGLGTPTSCYSLSGCVSATSITKLEDNAMKLRDSFVINKFDDYYIMSPNLNNGYPILKAFVSFAQVSGFEGEGTATAPYQIITKEDLQGMATIYNALASVEEFYWILINDIDISTDANGLTNNWTPIGYEGGVATGFNGHFDGNGKTISGLTITEQYENVGLFGRLANNATITNLNVSGAISWDQAKYVGGVVGLMEDGATLTNCSFTGTITGYLNSGNVAVIGGLAGKYSTDAITGSANYDCYVYGTDNYTTFNRFNSNYSIA